MTYQEWIEANVADPYGRCEEATAQMAEAFPELRRVRGHYYCFAWGERQHWWMEDAEGNVVDPTAAQFPSGGRGHYEEWDGSPLPTGSCPQCSNPVYDGGTCCSEACHAAYVAYCTNPGTHWL